MCGLIVSPERIFFNVLANDNDGEGRRYCVELAPGISEGKTNDRIPDAGNAC